VSASNILRELPDDEQITCLKNQPKGYGNKIFISFTIKNYSVLIFDHTSYENVDLEKKIQFRGHPQSASQSPEASFLKLAQASTRA
jgi:hypothetical protein